MTDKAELVFLSVYKQEREDYAKRRTERHKRRLLIEHAKEGLPAFPGGIDDMELGDK